MSISLDDSVDSSVFGQYEADFQYTYQDLTQKLEDMQSLPAGERKSAVNGLNSLIDEAYEIIDQMAVEVQSIPSGSRAKFNSKIRTYRADVDRSKRQVKSLAEDVDRGLLFGDRDQRVDEQYSDDLGNSQRQELLGTQQRLEQSSERLRDSQRVANETETIGAGILNDLRGQREQIVNSRNTLSDADTYVDRSLRTLRTMARRMAANRIITYAIIAVLILLIILVLASKFT